VDYDQLSMLSATEIVSQVSTSAITCEEIARACIERVKLRETTVKAWSFFDPDRVLRQAREFDLQPHRGQLHGVPIGVKVIIDTCDMPTEMGSPIYQGYQPDPTLPALRCCERRAR
jgi:Asp-tRNA(Asn)/Glu-tRNA(Gln) amidotransferase A subunit family amidase